MTKKKQCISATELFIWKLVGILLVVTWVFAIAFTILLANQYGWDDIGFGFITFFTFLILIPVSFVALYLSMFRLNPKGLNRTIGMSVLVIISLPLVVFVANYLANTNSGDPLVLSFPVGLITAFTVFMLFKRLQSN